MADDQKALKKRLKTVMSLPHNQICSDCNERQPRWASLIVPPAGVDSGGLAIGALCCLECSGSHRRLGVHISFVRSINLDSCTYLSRYLHAFLFIDGVDFYLFSHLLCLLTGKEKEVLAMENGGNAKVNAIFEARLPSNSNIKPTNHADGPTRERFIRDKYERRKYFDPSASTSFSNMSQTSGGGTSSESAASSVGPPSDAAKQRLEQRRARINEGLVTPHGNAATLPRTSSSVATTKSRPKVAKAPASAPVDLLGFDTPASEPSAPTTTKLTSAEFDLFDFSSTAGTAATNNGTAKNNSSSIDDEWNQLTSQASQPQQQTAKPSIDLASLYNGGQQQQQQQFGNFGPGSNMGYTANNANPMMMMNHNNPMQQMNVAMQNMNFANQHLTPQQVAYQQQQQQMMMMQQQQQYQMMLQQQMMMQQQQQQQFPSPNPPPTKVTTSKVSAAPEKDDPFAQFGTNMFR